MSASAGAPLETLRSAPIGIGGLSAPVRRVDDRAEGEAGPFGERTASEGLTGLAAASATGARSAVTRADRPGCVQRLIMSED